MKCHCLISTHCLTNEFTISFLLPDSTRICYFRIAAVLNCIVYYIYLYYIYQISSQCCHFPSALNPTPSQRRQAQREHNTPSSSGQEIGMSGERPKLNLKPRNEAEAAKNDEARLKSAKSVQSIWEMALNARIQCTP